jgi:hypothetical protein
MAVRRLVCERFAFRIMKEVRSFVYNGGHADEAREGLIITMAVICEVSEHDVRDALRSCGILDPRPSSGHGEDRPGQDD